MSTVANHPIQFLSPTSPSFWRWERELVIFESGATLAFRQEIQALVEHLQPYGLPSMETLLLFLAATRQEFLWEACLAPYEERLLERSLPSGWIGRVLSEMQKIRTLDVIWTKDLKHKCLLAEVCFEHASTLLSPDEAQGVADLLESGFVPLDGTIEEEAEEAARRFVQGVRPFLEGLPILDERRLEHRLRTGMDVAVRGFVREELSLGAQVRYLLDDLDEDAEWQGLARLVRHLMAAVSVPRALGDPDDLPLGGFSDLSNRGALDRLLVSELAQDDLVLSARLALNEALYLRRESPPKNPEQGRLLLIDNGIRLWGMPRLFAVAVALAMEGKADDSIRFECFVPTVHQQLCDVRLHTREGLLEALTHLHAHAHPGNALLELVKRSKAAKECRELILITHADVLEDPAFQAVSDLVEQSFFVATVDRRGHYAFYQCTQERRRLLQQTRLNLEDLLRDPGEAACLKRPGVPAELPDIFHQKPFPIRLPSHELRNRTVFTQDQGVFKSSRDGRLLHFDDAERGGVQIADDLPEGRALPVVEVQGLVDGRHVVAFFQKKQLEVCFVDLGSGAWESWRVSMDKSPQQLVVTHQQILIIHAGRVVLHEIRHGEAMAEISLRRSVERCYGDLMLLGSEWHRISVDGLKPCLEIVDQKRVLESSKMEEYSQQAMGGLRKKFRGISVDGTKIVLHKARSEETVCLSEDGPAFYLRPIRTQSEPLLFKETAGPSGSRIQLREAVWPNGSRVVLDSRGLLHFVSRTREVEDLSVVLSGSGPLPMWSATLGGHGNGYYVDTSLAAGGAEFAALILGFIKQTRC